MARICRGLTTSTEMPLCRHSTLHMVPLFRQTQSLAAVPTHLPSTMATTNLARHHDLRVYMERCTEYPRFIRLCANEHHPPGFGEQVP